MKYFLPFLWAFLCAFLCISPVLAEYKTIRHNSDFNCAKSVYKKQQKLGLVLAGSKKKSILNKEQGCQIKNIIPLSPAWFSVLQNDDWILAVNNIDIKNKEKPCQFLIKTIKKSNENLNFSVKKKAKENAPASDYSVTLNKVNQIKLLNHQTDMLLPENCLSSSAPFRVMPQIQAIQSNSENLNDFVDNMSKKVLQSTDSLYAINNIFEQDKKKLANNLYLKNDQNVIKDLTNFMKSSHELTKNAFRLLTEKEHSFFVKHYTQLSETLTQGALYNESEREKLDTIVELFKIAAKVDLPQLAFAAKNWNQLVNQDWSKFSFPKEKTKYSTPYGDILLGTTGDDVYTIENEMAVIIDPAGDDYYQWNNQFVANYKIYNRAIIDLSGHDNYSSLIDTGVSSAILGVSLFSDKKGNDQYRSKSWSQSSAFAGASFFYDLQGDDTYIADSFAQASALFGTAQLIDLSGNDSYTIEHHGQAIGLPYGKALLYDAKGDDSYTSLKSLKSSYSTKDSYESWAQGVGKGFRYILPGGIGFLVDKAGDDKFIAGEFAQGNGYYFGMGVLYNLGMGNDLYQGTRYNLGSSAHQAIAAFLDAGGNDKYQTSGPAFCGSGWDQSIAYFSDLKGDDCYSGVNFSFAATHTSATFFNDAMGSNQFFNKEDKQCF